ncbi:hypothetical protein HCB45_06305 [Listeria sp. FSL L7-0091]|uniref:hypothetical protein n=1 Tax=Listeria farberi TaxID=2713500 RepID=UPI00162930D9|nr:hypothetical protein [Listeria farberi]MBC2261205.1 hypothetical protein [Listeria farberi]
MANNGNESGTTLSSEPLFHGSTANFDQFAYQQKYSAGISGLAFGIYLTNDRDTALDFAQNKYLYEVNSAVLDGRAIESTEVTLSKEDIAHVVEELVKKEIQENEISYFFTDYFGEVAELNEKETWNELYTDLTNVVAEGMLDRASSDVNVVNELYVAFGGKNSENAASLLGGALKNIGVTHCVQTRRYEQERAIQEVVVFQPDELIIQDKMDLEKRREQQQSKHVQNEKEQDIKQVVPIVIPTKNKQKQNTGVLEEQLER